MSAPGDPLWTSHGKRKRKARNPRRPEAATRGEAPTGLFLSVVFLLPPMRRGQPRRDPLCRNWIEVSTIRTNKQANSQLIVTMGGSPEIGPGESPSSVEHGTPHV